MREHAHPRQNEIKYSTVSNLNDGLTLDVINYNGICKDKGLSIASFAPRKLRR